jgi:predicted nuclease with TOPRIM domain
MTELEKLQEENEVLRERVDRLTAEKEEVIELAQRISDDRNNLESTYKSLETEFGRLRAQMDIVYLIFGKK